MNLYGVLKEINNTSLFLNYTEFCLKSKINIYDFKEIINKMNNQKNICCLYNKKTMQCDVVGVVDINNVRYIDFDDDMFTMINKGINFQVDQYIN
jgi:hypothetical protein